MDRWGPPWLKPFSIIKAKIGSNLNGTEKARGLIIFEGDYVTLTGEPEWLEVVEIVIVDGNRANNMLKLSDGYVVPAPVERYVDEVISKKEFIALS